MFNHLDVILRARPDIRGRISDCEVAERWRILNPKPSLLDDTGNTSKEDIIRFVAGRLSLKDGLPFPASQPVGKALPILAAMPPLHWFESHTKPLALRQGIGFLYTFAKY